MSEDGIVTQVVFDYAALADVVHRPFAEALARSMATHGESYLDVESASAHQWLTSCKLFLQAVHDNWPIDYAAAKVISGVAGKYNVDRAGLARNFELAYEEATEDLLRTETG